MIPAYQYSIRVAIKQRRVSHGQETLSPKRGIHFTLFASSNHLGARTTTKPGGLSPSPAIRSTNGWNAPASSIAEGTIKLVEGSLEETGTVRVVIRGLDETREEFRTPRGLRGRIFKKGEASRLTDEGVESVSLELAASSQATGPRNELPLPIRIRWGMRQKPFRTRFSKRLILQGRKECFSVRQKRVFLARLDWGVSASSDCIDYFRFCCRVSLYPCAVTQQGYSGSRKEVPGLLGCWVGIHERRWL